MTALILADVPGAAEQLRHLFVRPRAAGDTLPALPHHPRIAPPDLIASTARPAPETEAR